jgi:hypothetical protein
VTHSRPRRVLLAATTGLILISGTAVAGTAEAAPQGSSSAGKGTDRRTGSPSRTAAATDTVRMDGFGAYNPAPGSPGPSGTSNPERDESAWTHGGSGAIHQAEQGWVYRANPATAGRKRLKDPHAFTGEWTEGSYPQARQLAEGLADGDKRVVLMAPAEHIMDGVYSLFVKDADGRIHIATSTGQEKIITNPGEDGEWDQAVEEIPELNLTNRRITSDRSTVRKFFRDGHYGTVATVIGLFQHAIPDHGRVKLERDGAGRHRYSLRRHGNSVEITDTRHTRDNTVRVHDRSSNQEWLEAFNKLVSKDTYIQRTNLWLTLGYEAAARTVRGVRGVQGRSNPQLETSPFTLQDRVHIQVKNRRGISLNTKVKANGMASNAMMIATFAVLL